MREKGGGQERGREREILESKEERKEREREGGRHWRQGKRVLSCHAAVLSKYGNRTYRG